MSAATPLPFDPGTIVPFIAKFDGDPRIHLGFDEDLYIAVDVFGIIATATDGSGDTLATNDGNPSNNFVNLNSVDEITNPATLTFTEIDGLIFPSGKTIPLGVAFPVTFEPPP